MARLPTSPLSSVASGSIYLVSPNAPQPNTVDVSLLSEEVEELRQRISALEEALFIDELEWDEALQRARKHFRSRRGCSVLPTELAEALGTSVSQALDLCEALEREGAVVAENEAG